MITEDYVSFETAKLLNEKGFDEYCLYIYMIFGSGTPRVESKVFMSGERSVVNNEDIKLVAEKYGWEPYSEDDKYAVLCPSVQMAMKWLREVYNINPVPYALSLGWAFDVFDLSNRDITGCKKLYSMNFPSKSEVYNTYEQACEAAIKYCLENLIGNKKEDEDVTKKPFAILTNPKTGRWFYVKNYKITRSQVNSSCDVTAVITPRNIDDTIPVIGKCRLDVGESVSKKDCIGDNEKLHIEVFDANGVKRDENFLYNSWIQCVNYETNTIVLNSDYMV